MTLRDRTEEADGARATFEEFVATAEPRVRRALVLVVGPETARDATADALLEVWRRWDRVRQMSNPVGYLYTVARRRVPRRPRFDAAELSDHLADQSPDHWVEPRLLGALQSLPERQRVSVYLMAGCGWTAPEVAELTGVAATTVRTHLDRGMAQLRSTLGADDEEHR
ncbi:MAG TPA: sigma-70 family RNA polymerase sigma factor [Iamia sp.]|nr:sigma-70 family RNA polymerase sigma factor [Iamia sp.]